MTSSSPHGSSELLFRLFIFLLENQGRSTRFAHAGPLLPFELKLYHEFTSGSEALRFQGRGARNAVEGEELLQRMPTCRGLLKVTAHGSCAPHVVCTHTSHVALRDGAASHDRPVCLLQAVCQAGRHSCCHLDDKSHTLQVARDYSARSQALRA